MARGLSELQQMALMLAYENDAPTREAWYKSAEEGSPMGIDCRVRHEDFVGNPHYHDGLRHWFVTSSQELYHYFYGLPWSEYRWKGQPRFVAVSPTSAMKVAVSKAFKRLTERGLGINARGYGSGGYCLTPAGVAMAQQLLAN